MGQEAGLEGSIQELLTVSANDSFPPKVVANRPAAFDPKLTLMFESYAARHVDENSFPSPRRDVGEHRPNGRLRLGYGAFAASP